MSPPPTSGDFNSNPERSGDFDLSPFELVTGGATSANFSVSASSRYRVVGKRASDLRHDLIALTFDF